MFRNILISTFRNLKRNKLNTLINVVGLAISIACAITIYAFIRHEYSFDHFHSRADRIYRLVTHYRGSNGLSKSGHIAFPVATALRNDFPDAGIVSQVYAERDAVIKVEDEQGGHKLFEENDVAYADEFFLQTFDYERIAGPQGKLLQNPDEVVLTRKLAEKFFGYTDAGRMDELIGKTLIINQQNYRITAILEDVPRNTNVPFTLLLPYRTFAKNNETWVSEWNSTSSGSYVFFTFPEGQSPAELESRLPAFVKKYFDEEAAARTSYFFQPLAEVHTDESYGGTVYATPAILIVAFVTMGIIVLLTACINFINLATAQSVKRAKEIGIRKTLGSLRGQIILQYIGETLLLTLLATLIGLWIAQEFIQAFNSYLSPVIDYGLQLDYTVFYFLLALLLLTALLAGYYPAHVLASFHPVEALRKSLNTRKAGFAGGFSLRKSLVVVQFVISQILLIGTIIVASQMRYVHERDLGFKKDNMIITFIPENNRQKSEQFKAAIGSQAVVRNVSFSSGPPLSSSNSGTSMYRPEMGGMEKISIERKYVDPDYLETFGIKLLAGRDLTENDRVYLTDSTPTYNLLLNEKAVHQLGFTSPEEALGHTVYTYGEQEAIVVGVVEDFFNNSLQEEIRPCLLFYGTNWTEVAAISLHEDRTVAELPFLQTTWEELYPDHFFLAMTMDEYFEYGAFYVIEDVMYQAFRIFAFLSILIGCLGLYGLVSYLALQRQKEIGVRKTLGAGIAHIIYLFSREFTLLVLIAYLIAAPVGFFAMQAWLETFAYRIALSPWIFVLAFLASLLIAWLTVGYKSLSAALSNPVDSLRSE